MDDGANDIFESAAASFSLLAGISICCLVGMSTVLQLNCECESSQNTELWETMVEFERMIVRLTREGVALVEVAGAVSASSTGTSTKGGSQGRYFIKMAAIIGPDN